MKDKDIIKNETALTEIIRSLIDNQNLMKQEILELKNRRINSMTVSEKVKFINDYGLQAYRNWRDTGNIPGGDPNKEDWQKDRSEFAIMIYEDNERAIKKKIDNLSDLTRKYYAKYNFPPQWNWTQKKAVDYVRKFINQIK